MTSFPRLLPSIALLLVPLPLVTACSAGEAGAPAERADSAGISLVTNTAEDRPLPWSFAPELTLGGEDFYAVGRWSVDADDRGVIHVLDQDGKRVLRYGPDGESLGALGRPGQGPGEMEWPNLLDVAPDGRVNVSDFGRGRVISWAPDGSLLGEDTEVDAGSIFRRLAGGEARQLSVWEEGSSTSRLVHITEGGDTTEVARATVSSKPVEFESCGIRIGGMSPIFAPSLRWDAAGERIAAVGGADYDVLVSDAGTPVLRIRRRLVPPPATEAMALADLGEGMAITTSGGRRVCDPGEVVEQRGMADVVPLIEQVVVEPRGRVWVQRFVAGDEPGAIDVFESDGEYLGTLPAGTPLPIGFLPDGRVMTSQTDELDVQRLVIGRFVEQADG